MNQHHIGKKVRSGGQTLFVVAAVPHDRPVYVVRNRAATELYLLDGRDGAKVLELENARVLIAASLEPRHPQAVAALRKVEGRAAWEAHKRGQTAAPRAFEAIWMTAARVWKDARAA